MNVLIVAKIQRQLRFQAYAGNALRFHCLENEFHNPIQE